MNNYISTAPLYDSGYLAHHGIKGQKWGIRRFQNPDGSLTAAGEKRYNKISDKMNKIAEQYVAGQAFLLYLQNKTPYDLAAIDNAKSKYEKYQAQEQARINDELFENIYHTQISRLKKYKKMEEYAKEFGNVPFTLLEKYPGIKNRLQDSPYNKV